MNNLDIKTCRKCGDVKAADQFSPRARSRDGRRAVCRQCMNDYQRSYTASRPGYGAAKSKRWKLANPEIVRTSERDRRSRNVEQFRAKYRRQYAANAEKRAQAARYRRQRDRNAYNEIVRLRRAAHPEKHRAVAHNRRIKERTGKISPADILMQMEKQNGLCAYCDSDVRTSYEVDHFISLANGGANDPSNIVIACKNCNRRKNRLNGPEFIAKLARMAA